MALTAPTLTLLVVLWKRYPAASIYCFEMSFPGLRKRHLLGNGNPWWEEEKQHPTTRGAI